MSRLFLKIFYGLTTSTVCAPLLFLSFWIDNVVSSKILDFIWYLGLAYFYNTPGPDPLWVHCGTMKRYLIENEIDNYEGLLGFNGRDYSYIEKHADDKTNRSLYIRDLLYLKYCPTFQGSILGRFFIAILFLIA